MLISFIVTNVVTVRKRSCEKVMFLQLSVILFTGGCLPGYTHTPCPVHAGIHTPPCPVHAGIHTHPLPSACWDTHTHPLPSACWDTHTPCPVHAGIHTSPRQIPPKMATAADGTHPTGMHSCSYYSIGQLSGFLLPLDRHQVPSKYCGATKKKRKKEKEKEKKEEEIEYLHHEPYGLLIILFANFY